MVRVLVVQFFEIPWVQGKNSTADCFGMGKMDCIVLTGEWRMYISGDFHIVASFEQ